MNTEKKKDLIFFTEMWTTLIYSLYDQRFNQSKHQWYWTQKSLTLSKCSKKVAIFTTFVIKRRADLPQAFPELMERVSSLKLSFPKKSSDNDPV